IKTRINKSVINQIHIDKNRVDYIFEKINNYLNLYTIKDKITQIDKIYDKINFEIENTMNIESEKLRNTGTILHNLSPLATLDRGYSIVHKEGNILNSVNEINLKENLDIRLRDGNIKCVVNSIENEEV
ncbi:MAG: exodeoxyribonuclease VII large subunit, partial [Romboutsia sp.]|nr:exodeoxyribonuclease VII large subunit [Romboutsia sp.]